MSDLRSSIWAIDFSPARLAVNVPIDSEVIIKFNVDLDETTVNLNTILLLENSVLPIAGTVSYVSEEKKVVFVPDTNLQSQTTYMLVLVGLVPGATTLDNYIKDVTGTPQPGNFSYTFTTSSTTLPAAPRILTPADQSVSETGVIAFSWSIVSGISQYEIQVATNTSFSVIVWSDIITTGNSVTRQDVFVDGLYYVRVRAYNNLGQPGNWSRMSSFRVGEVPEVGAAPITYIPPIQGFPVNDLEKFILLESTPPAGAIDTSLLLDRVRLFFNYPPNSGYATNIEIMGYNIGDELVPSGHAPIITGNVFYSGANYLDWLLTGPVPSGFDVLGSGQTLIENQEYTVRVLPVQSIYGDISDEYIFKFYTLVDPLYVTVASVRKDLGELGLSLDDFELTKLIYKYSLILRSEVPTDILAKLDDGLMSKPLAEFAGDTSGDLEIRKNIECYIRNAILADVIGRKLRDGTFGWGISKRLGDFSFSKGTDGFKTVAKPLLNEIENKRDDCLNELLGNDFENLNHGLRGGKVDPYESYDFRRM